jgi:alkanesulfonate monooxygenase SsuD/methylene tetrahydromethanopterin reductase-like flavin-dependent oxidoreductase (luciferase family)
MDIGIGLPNAVPGTDGEQLIEFARRADNAGFSGLGTIDRLIYPNYESLIALAAAAAVTERIPLATTVLLAPYRNNPALLAKQAATLQRLSGGRLTLGLGIGWREDDYEASGLSFEDRGKLFDEVLEQLGPHWSGSSDDTALGPEVSADPPQVILGGSIDKAFKRAAKYGAGWMLGGGTPEQFAEGREKLEAAWSEAGREGTPKGWALAYFALGASAEEDAKSYLTHYYAKRGAETANAIAASAATDEDTVLAYIQAFTEAGCDELFLMPCSPDPEQVDLLASAAL